MANVQSQSIQNLDALQPGPVTNTSGWGGAGYERNVSDYVKVTAGGQPLNSTYQVVRLPTEAVIKSLVFESTAQTSGAVSIGLAYSDSTVDGTNQANQGVVINSAFFSGPITVSAYVGPVNYVNGVSGSGSYPINDRTMPLWQAAGIGLTVNGVANSADPGGFLDVILKVTTALGASGGYMGVSVGYVI